MGNRCGIAPVVAGRAARRGGDGGGCALVSGGAGDARAPGGRGAIYGEDHGADRGARRDSGGAMRLGGD